MSHASLPVTLSDVVDLSVCLFGLCVNGVAVLSVCVVDVAGWSVWIQVFR